MKKLNAKRTIIIVLALLFLLSIIPIKQTLKDGGTVVYRALIYSVYDKHTIESIDPQSGSNMMRVGTVVELFGFPIFDNTTLVPEGQIG